MPSFEPQARPRSFRVAEVVYHCGDSPDRIYRIVSGYVLLDCDSLNGQACIVGLLGQGDYFGPGLTGEPASHRAVAKAGCRLHIESRKQFDQRMQNNPELALQTLSQLARREARLQQRLLLQQTATLHQRLAHTLADLFTECGGPCQHGHQRDIKLTQQELAAMVGGSRQSVSQTLNDWRREGIVDYTRHYLCLENRRKLEDLLTH